MNEAPTDMAEIQSSSDTNVTVEMGVAALRLHPLSLLLKLAKLLPQFIYIIPALYFGISKGGGSALILPAIAAIIALSMGAAYLQWRRFSYQVGEEEIRIASGVFSRNKRSIPYERIQDVNVEQKLLARLLGLASVKFETGSAGSDDGVLNAVSLERAEELRDIIRKRKAGIAAQDTGEAAILQEIAEAEEVEPVFAMDSRRVLTAGIFNFSLVIFAVLGAAAQNFDFLIPDEMFDADYWIDRMDAPGKIGSLGIWAQIVGLVGGLFSLIFIGLFTGITTTFFREYGFRLDRTENGFRRRRGLTTLTDVVMPLHRIQAASILTGPIKRRFGWHHLKFQSLASDGKNSDHSVAPLATLNEIDRIMAEPGIRREAGKDYLPVMAAHWIVPSVIFTLLIIVSGTALGTLVDNRLFWLMLLIAPLILILWLRWKHHKYVLTDGQLFVREGFWRQKCTILPIRKVQSVDISQSFLARALGNANIVIGVAGGSGILPLTIHAVAAEKCEPLRAELLSPHQR